MLDQNKNSHTLSEELPYWHFSEELIPHAVLHDGSISSGLKISMKDLDTLSDEEVNQITVKLRNLLNSVDEGMVLQFWYSQAPDHDFTQKIVATEMNEKNSNNLIVHSAHERSKNFQLQYEQNELMTQSLFLYLRMKPQNNSAVRFFKKQKYFEDMELTTYLEMLEKLKTNLEGIKNSLSLIGVDCESLSKAQLIRKVLEFLDPGNQTLLNQNYAVKEVKESEGERELLKKANMPISSSLREQLCFRDLVLQRNKFLLGETEHKIVTLKTLPEITFAGMMSQFLQMKFPFDFILTIDIPYQGQEIQRLNQQRKMAFSMASNQSGNPSDLESETKLSSAEELIRELLSTGQRIYSTQTVVLLKEDFSENSERSLNRATQEVLAHFRSLYGAEGLVESLASWKIMKGILPLAPLYLERAKKMKTHNLADFLPFYAPRKGVKDPKVILKNRLGGIVGHDGFGNHLPNFNSLVTGSSGAGKSFLSNCILLQEISHNHKAYIIDIGGSYRKLTNAVDGQYFEFDFENAFCINPMDLNGEALHPSSQKLKSLITILECMASDDGKVQFTKLEKSMLEMALVNLYSAYTNNDTAPTLSDLKNFLELSSEPFLKKLSQELYLWTGSSAYGKLLDGQGSFKENAQVCTFDLKGLTGHPDLQSVMVLIITDYLLSKIDQDKECKKRIVMDEVWSLLKSSGASQFMEYCARTLRKTGSGITFITQGLEEIVASPIGSAIMNNTAIKFIMLQRGDTKILKENLKLNPREIDLIQSLGQKKGEFSEGFLIDGEERQVIRVHPTATEYWLSTSDAKDNNFLESQMVDGKTLVEAIKYAANHFPYGVLNHAKDSVTV